MKTRKSSIGGGVIVDVGRTGGKRSANSNITVPFRPDEHTRFLASLEERATKPYTLDATIPSRHLAVHA
jgi:hypothetical protein